MRDSPGREPLFSIGVTTYDRTDLLLETLSSILAQTFTDFEVIVCNDNPARVVSAASTGLADSRIRFMNNAVNLGEHGSMNELLRLSRGRYFSWIADDDLYEPGLLQEVYNALVDNQYPKAVCTSFMILRGGVAVGHGIPFSGSTRMYSGPEFLRSFLAHEINTMGTMGFYDAAYLRQLGGLEDVSADGMGFYCEYMLLLRASELPVIAYVDAPLMFFRAHDQSWSSSLNTDLAQFRRASVNLIHEALVLFRKPDRVESFDENLRNILQWFMSECVNAARRAGRLGPAYLASYFLFACEYIRPLKKSALYLRGAICLLRAEGWLLSALARQKVLADAPAPIVNVAYALRRAVFGTPPRPPRVV